MCVSSLYVLVLFVSVMKQQKTEDCIFEKGFREELMLISGSFDAQKQPSWGTCCSEEGCAVSSRTDVSEILLPGDNLLKENVDLGIECINRMAQMDETE